MSTALARQWDYYDYDEEEDLAEVETVGLEVALELPATFEEYEIEEEYDSEEVALAFTNVPLPLAHPSQLPAPTTLALQPFSFDPNRLPAVPPVQAGWFGQENVALARQPLYAYGVEESLPRPSILDDLRNVAVGLTNNRLVLWIGGAVLSLLILTSLLSWLGNLGHHETSIYSFGNDGSVITGEQPKSQVAGAPPQVAPGAHYVAGQPTITPSRIDAVLQQYKSPAAGKGQALYDLGVKYGIDPAYPLAFFIHESSAGTAGIAVTTKSIGNIRYTSDSGFENYQGFRKYPSWEAGMEDWYKLISGLYVKSWGLKTVEAIIPKYAPAADRNNPTAYINNVNSLVEGWRNGK